MKCKVFIWGLLFLSLNGIAQSSSEIYKQLKAFNFLGNVLYLAAHPDDENTRLISYFANHKMARTAYLSITRGDGGQNLIGTELEENLGVIRTQELLAARTVDGGQQYFTTAKDFGYSKHPDEAFSVWDKEALLAQVVYRIRKFKPDLIINRFDHRTPGSTHGHHTGSAILSHEAFKLANDPNAFPEQLQEVDLWQPQRLFYNTSWWAYGSRNAFENADKSNMVEVNGGVYDPLTGQDNTVVAAQSRSQHKSQGFGSSPQRGNASEYLERIAGPMVRENDPFWGIDTSWKRVKGGAAIASLMDAIIAAFDFNQPHKSVANLLLVYEKVEQLEDAFWKAIKREAIAKLIKSCLGLEVQANAANALGTPGTPMKVAFMVHHPSPIALTLKHIKVNEKTILGKKLEQNNSFRSEISLLLPDQYTTPYWLLEKGSVGNYSVGDTKLIGTPETPPVVEAQFTFEINGKPFVLSVPLKYRTTSPVAGEVIAPFHLLPKVTLAWEKQVVLFSETKPKTVRLQLKAHAQKVSGQVSLKVPLKWQITPTSQPFEIAQKGSTQTIEFLITPPNSTSEANLSATVNVSGKTYPYALQEIDYDHIPKQYILQPNTLKVSRKTLQTSVNKVGYIAGAGDKIPESLETIGIEVEQLKVETLQLDQITHLPTLVVGIRAFNVLEALKTKNKLLWDYAAQGGTVVFQYNTSRNLKTQDLTPYPLSLSRDRVTNETAAVTFLNPAHPLLNSPNTITAKDFDGWVQERGLYFPNQWDPHFEPLFGMADSNESQKNGSLLVASHGKGQIIYTGLSFFRQLPKGVSGAYALFVNLISYGHEKK
ncbi:MAG: PIG-L family deacetylase [Flavobacteriaceae bacterium]